MRQEAKATDAALPVRWRHSGVQIKKGNRRLIASCPFPKTYDSLIIVLRCYLVNVSVVSFDNAKVSKNI